MVDQPATVGALPVAVARAEGVLVAYLPGLAMRRIADLHAGEAKTDARDAYILAEAARSMPHTLRSLKLADDELAELTMLCGFDDDLAGQITQTSNRIRGLLTQIHPALERVLGPRLDHPAVLDLLDRYPSPAQLAAVSEKQLANRLVKLAPRMGKGLAAEIVQALSEQTVVVLGTQAASIVLPRLAQQLAALRRQRQEVAKEVERLVLAHPLHPVLTSMPGVGVRTAARLLIDVVTRAFASAGHLAAYAGLAPVTRRSGSSIRGEHPSRRGNKQLKRAMFLSAFAALRDPISRAYYERKISQGKRHNQALIALARRRCDVLFAMLRNGEIRDTHVHALVISCAVQHHGNQTTPILPLLFGNGTSRGTVARCPWRCVPLASADQRGTEPTALKTNDGCWSEKFRIREPSGAFGVIYLASRAEGVYILHSFQKKIQKTPQRDLDLATTRFKAIPRAQE